MTLKETYTILYYIQTFMTWTYERKNGYMPLDGGNNMYDR